MTTQTHIKVQHQTISRAWMSPTHSHPTIEAAIAVAQQQASEYPTTAFRVAVFTKQQWAQGTWSEIQKFNEGAYRP
jgi:hypothetical protein